MKSEVTLRTRLIMLVMAAIFPLFGLSVVKAVLSTDAAVTSATKNLEFSASLVAANQERVADSARQLLGAIVNMPELVAGKGVDCQRYFRALSDQLKVYANIGIVGSDGYVRCHNTSNNPPGFAGDRPYFLGAKSRRTFVAGGYLVGRLSGRPIISFAQPIMGAQDQVAGVAFASMYVSEISRAMAGLALPRGSRMVVMDREGIVLAANPEGSAVLGQQVPSQVLRNAISAGSQGVFEGRDAAGVPQIYTFLPSDKSAAPPFFVAVSLDRSEVIAPAQRQLMLEFTALILVAFFGAWLAWMMGGRAIVRPTAIIMEATSKLQSGQIDIRIPMLEGRRGSEFTRIAGGINRMADSLAQREHELAVELLHSQEAHSALEQLQLAQSKSYAELRETQRKLLDAQRLGLIGHWELDMTTGRLHWSDELHELFGTDRETFDGDHMKFMQLVHADDRAMYQARRDEAHRNGTQLEVEYRIITPAGQTRWMHQRGRVHRDEASGKIVSRNGVVQDITARKQSELALASRTEQLRRTGEVARVGGWEVNLETLEGDWSEEYFRIHDLDPSRRLDILEALAFYAPDAQPVIQGAVVAAKEEGTPWDLELPLVTFTGRRIWVRTQGMAVMKDGKAVGLAGALQDITAQHESREHLRLLENAISRLNDIVLITEAEPLDAPGPRIIFVNDAFEDRTGYTRNEVLGKSPRILQGPKTQGAELDRVRSALEKWQPVRAELINYKKNGEEFWIELDIVPIADARGWFTHWVAVERDITERKLSEQALVESEQRYAALFDMAPVPMWVYDIDTLKFLAVNNAAVESYGYTAAEFMGMTIFDIRAPSEHEGLRQHLELLPTTKKQLWQHRRKDATVFPVNVVSRPTRHGGRSARFVVALDMTAQVNAEKEVQEYLFTLQRAADAAQAITWHQTLHGMLQEVTEQARGVIGAHQAVVSLTAGRSWPESIHVLSLSDKYAEYRDVVQPHDGTGIYAMVRQTNSPLRMTQAELETHPQWKGFGIYSRKNPAMRGWLAVPLMGRTGQNIGLLQLSDKYTGEFTLQDEYVAIELAQLASIAIENAQLLEQVNQLNTGLEQKIAERTAALVRQEALFRALSEQAPQVVWTVDPDGKATYFNRAWFDLVGGQMEDWTGSQWTSVIHADDLPSVKAAWDLAVANQAPFVGLRRLRDRNGNFHTMSYRASPVLDDDGNIAFWVGIDADVTEIKSIEAALRLSNQELEAFSYSVSHDLRAPLNTIDGFSRLLAKQLATDVGSKGQHYLTRIQVGVAQMGKLIEDLLSLAQVSRMQLRYDAIDLSALSRSILDDWQGRHPERRVAIAIEKGLLVHGDGRLIKVLMENLLANAWKFTSRREQAEISVGQQTDAGGQPVFFVRDNGAGFDMAYADKLFLAFQRLHAASEFPGTGIGLATVSRVVARHSGRLWAESAPEKGATFYFTLPNVSV